MPLVCCMMRLLLRVIQSSDVRQPLVTAPETSSSYYALPFSDVEDDGFLVCIWVCLLFNYINFDYR